MRLTIDSSDDEIEAGMVAARAMLATLKAYTNLCETLHPSTRWTEKMKAAAIYDAAKIAIAQAEAAGIK